MSKSKDVQFYHNKEMGYTTAVNVNFNAHDLADVITKPVKSIDLDIGFAYCHPTDQYNKSIGRAKALDKMEHLTIYLTNITVDNQTQKLFYNFIGGSNEKEINVLFRVSSNSEKPHFLHASDMKSYIVKNRDNKQFF